MQRIEFGLFILDPAKRIVIDAKGADVSLTAREFDILELLIRNAGTLVEREAFAAGIWKAETVGETTLTTHIAAIRKKLNAAQTGAGNYILTVQGRGYRFTEKISYLEELSSVNGLAPFSPAAATPTFAPSPLNQRPVRRWLTYSPAARDLGIVVALIFAAIALLLASQDVRFY